MPQTGMDWWVVAGVIVAVIAAFIAWKQLRRSKPGIEQTMTNSRGSSQTATREDVRQTMTDTTDGDQNA